MKLSQIVDRVAYEVGDVGFDMLTKVEYGVYVERALRQLAIASRAMRGEITLTCTASQDMPIIGPSSALVDINAIYYVKYTPVGSTIGKKAFERTYDDNELDGKQLTELPLTEYDARTFTVIRESETVKLRWSHVPNAGDTVLIKYYRAPVPGTLALDSEVPIGLAYHDDLVTGGLAFVWRRLYHMATLGRKGYTPEQAKNIFYAYKEANDAWTNRIQEIRRQLNQFMDETTPTIMQVGSPFDMYADDDRLIVENE